MMLWLGWGVGVLLALMLGAMGAAKARRDRWRADLTSAYAARNDLAVTQLASRFGPNEELLWRRLLTARSALEESAAEESRSRRDMEDVLASLQDAVLVVDDEGRLRFLNASALRLFNLRIEDVLGANLVEALPSFGLDSAMRAALRNGQSSEHELQLYSPRPREVFLRVAPVFSGAGARTGAVAIVQDLTEIRHLERVRRDFVSNASHELRTPIATVRALAETLQSADGDPNASERFLPPLISEAERLSRLVSDLLDLARAENATPSPFARVGLRPIISNTVARLRDKAKRRGISIEWNENEDAPNPTIEGDAAALEQVAFNLLDNALSYTVENGHVTLDVGDENGTAFLKVADNGIGIPADDLPRVFERFYRVDKARSRAEGGTGLGLAIVKHIIETHGGHVEVESTVAPASNGISPAASPSNVTTSAPPSGTRFTVHLPLADHQGI